MVGLRVADIATLFAGPSAATILADFGADVIKIEHPLQPDPARTHGKTKDGLGLWWKGLSRNKRTATINLSMDEGREVFLRLIENMDVVVENFRPGTLEKWNLGYDVLSAINPRLILARVTGFGQFGPLSSQPAFGTLAEAMSGFAYSTGQADGPPTLPPLALADNISGLALTVAILMAVHERATSGLGQVIDVAIIEPILAALGPQITSFDQLGHITRRTGNRSENNAPRNIYKTSDGDWVAVSSSATSIAERVMTLVGFPEVTTEPWFPSGQGRAEHADILDGAVSTWIGDRTTKSVLEAFRTAQAAISLVYDISQVVNDEQYRAIGTVVRVPDPDFGSVAMQNVLFRLSRTPGAIEYTGKAHGADTDAILREIGYSDTRIDTLHAIKAV